VLDFSARARGVISNRGAASGAIDRPTGRFAGADVEAAALESGSPGLEGVEGFDAGPES